MKTRNAFNNWIVYSALAATASLSGCTKMLPNAFLLEQQTQAFNTNVQINTKIDMLWVVDNSSSMDANQKKLRAGFAAFAQKYMQPTWDIRVAAIPTDAYLANPIYTNYLSTTLSGSAGANDPYISSAVNSGVYNPPNVNGTYITPTNNAAWNVDETSVVQMSGASKGDYSASGVTVNQLVPAWGPNYAKLIAGIHDGPVAGLCGSFMPYFLNAENLCGTRDSRAKTGTADCLSPATGESDVTQCVNTVQNDTVHSGLPIISTMPPTGTPGDATWVQGLINNFMINLTTGTAGHGSSREFGSVLQFLTDNEATGSTTSFFRPGSLRVVVFITDADDQTMTYSAADQANASFTPWTHYECDLNTLNTLNNGNGRLPANFCCTGGSCKYGADGTSCPSKTIKNNDGSDYTYTVTTCANPTLLTPVSTVKSQLDTFFSNLDGGNGASPNYLVVTITGLTGDSVRALQAVHDSDDTTVNTAVGATPVQVTADRADRIIDLGNLVGNGSMSLDITSSDYSPVLDAIGNEIIAKKGTFTLAYPATNQADMTVQIVHQDGSTTTVQNNQYTISGTTLTITDLNLILTFASTDKLNVNYQPSSSI